jgi:hypothetical protein
VHEHIRAALFRRHEAVALFGIEELHGAVLARATLDRRARAAEAAAIAAAEAAAITATAAAFIEAPTRTETVSTAAAAAKAAAITAAAAEAAATTKATATAATAATETTAVASAEATPVTAAGTTTKIIATAKPAIPLVKSAPVATTEAATVATAEPAAITPTAAKTTTIPHSKSSQGGRTPTRLSGKPPFDSLRSPASTVFVDHGMTCSREPGRAKAQAIIPGTSLRRGIPSAVSTCQHIARFGNSRCHIPYRDCPGHDLSRITTDDKAEAWIHGSCRPLV